MQLGMSALGQKRTYAVQNGMSALPPIATAKADIESWQRFSLSVSKLIKNGGFVYGFQLAKQLRFKLYFR